jgi:hypothetical protein
VAVVATHSQIEQHPDLLALRARYAEVSARPSAQAAEGLSLLTGLYLAISPWVVGFSAMRSITVNNLITGIALAALAGGLASAYGRTYGMAWLAPIVGIWTIIAPWVVRGGVDTTATIANNVATGAVAVVVGLAAMSITALSRR